MNRRIVLGIIGLSLLARSAAAAEVISADHKAKFLKSQKAAVAYLLKNQAADGSWGAERANPAVTGLAVRALLGAGVDAKSAEIAKALTYLRKFAQPDGAISRDLLRNYSTAICLMAFHAAGQAEDKTIIKKAQECLIKGQYGHEEHVDEFKNPKNPWFGGNGYGSHAGRPDLSNTQLMLEALHESGLPKDHPAWQRAIKFLERCQARAESNDQPWAKTAGDEGGFVYDITDSKAPKVIGPDGVERLRTYGSMTYAGFKSFLYCGVKKDDPRVKSSYEWIRRNYALNENPFMGKQGLFYYYHTFGKALAAWGEPTVKDARGGVHNWREELIDAIALQQKEDGSFVNATDRWMEGDPRLATSFILLAMEECGK